MGTPETSREPCPDRIIDDIGGAFGMGAVGGSAFHFLKGLYNSPKVPASSALPKPFVSTLLASEEASLYGVVSSLPLTVPWSTFVKKKTLGTPSLPAPPLVGFLSMRQGLTASARSAAFGGVLLALIEGAGIMLNKVLSAQQPPPMIMDEPAPGYPTGGLPGQQALPPVDSETKPWFGGGWFGENKKKDETVSSGGSETKVLESFDAPPVPNFEYK